MAWDEITSQGIACTNYQILPGDRVFIAEDRWIACDTYLAKVTAPFERLMGFSLLGVGTATRFSGNVLAGGGIQGQLLVIRGLVHANRSLRFSVEKSYRQEPLTGGQRPGHLLSGGVTAGGPRLLDVSFRGRQPAPGHITDLVFISPDVPEKITTRLTIFCTR